jgi:hemerythrin-like metal-binding protein
MEAFPWLENYEIGITHIDQQHKSLFEIANRFSNACLGEGNQEHILSVFNELIRYAELHFRDEESIMEQLQIKPEEVEEHKVSHENLVKEVFAVHEEFSKNGLSAIGDIRGFIQRWLIFHVLSMDKKINEYAAGTKDLKPT